jgi:hypothetical protein
MVFEGLVVWQESRIMADWEKACYNHYLVVLVMLHFG